MKFACIHPRQYIRTWLWTPLVALRWSRCCRDAYWTRWRLQAVPHKLNRTIFAFNKSRVEYRNSTIEYRKSTSVHWPFRDLRVFICCQSNELMITRSFLNGYARDRSSIFYSYLYPSVTLRYILTSLVTTTEHRKLERYVSTYKSFNWEVVTTTLP